jgi:hypothetical protein
MGQTAGPNDSGIKKLEGHEEIERIRKQVQEMRAARQRQLRGRAALVVGIGVALGILLTLWSVHLSSGGFGGAVSSTRSKVTAFVWPTSVATCHEVSHTVRMPSGTDRSTVAKPSMKLPQGPALLSPFLPGSAAVVWCQKSRLRRQKSRPGEVTALSYQACQALRQAKMSTRQAGTMGLSGEEP